MYDRAILSWASLVIVASCASYQAQPLPKPADAAHPAEIPAAPLNVEPPAARAHPPIARTPLKVNLADGLDADEGAVLAVLLNPELNALRATRGTSEAQILEAGILPNPVFAAEVTQPFGPGSEGTTPTLNLSLSYEIKPLIARSARQDAAKAELAQVDLSIAWQEWQVAQQARLQIIRLGWVRRRLQLAQEELDFEQQTMTALDQASTTADATLQQLGVQRAALEAARRTRDELATTDIETESELRALFGEPKVTALDVAIPTAAGGHVDRSIDECLAGRLDLEALRRGYDAQEFTVHAAVLDQFPQFSIGVTHQRDETSLKFIGGFVSMELPVLDRNQATIAVARATRTQLSGEYQSRVIAARAELAALLRLSALVARQLPVAHDSIAPLEAVETQERSAVMRGDIDLLSYQTVRSALIDQRLQEAALSQALAEAHVGLQTSCGEAYASGGKP
jgi:cobalt-zinc-cadmium efflux system outer membrane protein